MSCAGVGSRGFSWAVGLPRCVRNKSRQEGHTGPSQGAMGCAASCKGFWQQAAYSWKNELGNEDKKEKTGYAMQQRERKSLYPLQQHG